MCFEKAYLSFFMCCPQVFTSIEDIFQMEILEPLINMKSGK